LASRCILKRVALITDVALFLLRGSRLDVLGFLILTTTVAHGLPPFIRSGFFLFIKEFRQDSGEVNPGREFF
jgi:hypothetical protein